MASMECSMRDIAFHLVAAPVAVDGVLLSVGGLGGNWGIEGTQLIAFLLGRVGLDPGTGSETSVGAVGRVEE